LLTGALPLRRERGTSLPATTPRQRAKSTPAATAAAGAGNPAFYPGLDDWGYGRSIEWRFTRGGFDSLGAADVPPAGEWVHLACRTYLADGVGLVRADLSDLDGLIGEVAQPLLVQKRKRDSGVS
jgi:hypothetical protein